MHFKQIEMTGFKSFPDRTVLDLEDGITAVVGPNGCGKSNILDAMRWALGEQKPTQLRGAHMQDVIFNGSEDRAPMGMAEVTLTFDNSDGTLPIDFEEVQVTRRVYRSGEGEYLINKAPCRLRDVQELFMDTGIGTNAYSMIGQGKISMVLSSKPDDRRFLFEEAAGIIKYKSRKRIALRKLDQADQNVLRLGDIVHEVERQLRSLKRQVNAAIRHRELSDELKALEIREAWLKQGELVSQIEILRERFRTAQDRFESKSAEASELEAQHEALSLSKLEIDRTLHARRENVHEIESEMEKIEREIALIRQKVTFSEDQEETAVEERASLVAQTGELAQKLGEANDQLEALRQEQANIDEVLSAKAEALERASEAVASTDARLDAAREASVASMNARAQTQTELEKLGVNLSNLDEQVAALNARRADQERRASETAEQLASIEEQERTRHTEVAEAERRYAEHSEAVERLRADRETADGTRQQLREELGRIEARLTSFRELRDSYEGFDAAVQKLMQAKQADHPAMAGVVGPLGDLIQAAPEHAAAIEAALGGHVDSVVVETAGHARAAMAYLAEENAGRATFLPLDMLPSHSPAGHSVLRGQRLAALVNADVRAESAITYLLADAYLVEDLPDALRQMRYLAQRPTLVTAAGERLDPSGAITGGTTVAGQQGVIGRAVEIERLEAALATRTEETDAASAEVAGIEERIALAVDQRDAAKHELERLNAALRECSAESKRLREERERLAQLQREIDSERERLGERRAAFAEQEQTLLETSGRIEAEAATVADELSSAQAAANAARHAHAEIASSLADLRVHIAQLSQSIEETERDAARLQRELGRARSEAERRTEAIARFQEERAGFAADIEAHGERARTLSDSKDEARKRVVEAENERQSLLDQSEAIETSLKTLREEVREAQAEVHQTEIELRHDEDQLEFFRERIQSEYHVSLGALSADEVGEDDLDSETREARITEIRERLERMGAVNLMAIEEYDALTERHEFLVAQQADLSRARESLLDVVERIDKTITSMFVQTFNAVAENFHEYFRRLFNGGQARLYLLDEDDPLESGIEIEAKPPGKKPQSISLLSGGEQAMTAIALLFSIFKAKPSPFCVLDEVDAPLDDANIGRFVEMVGEFCRDTQFVVITHNKQTMAQADALYGVTQQERGVSQIVSVRFGDVRTTAA